MIDPYVRAEYLWRLIQDTTTVRVLIGPLYSTNDQDLIELRQTLALADRPIEVRQAADGVLHDRFIIGDSGVMYSVGASWNSVGKHVTTIFQHPPVTADRLGEIAEQWWEGASPVEPAAPFPTQPPADVVADAASAESPSTAPTVSPKPRRRGANGARGTAPDAEPHGRPTTVKQPQGPPGA